MPRTSDSEKNTRAQLKGKTKKRASLAKLKDDELKGIFTNFSWGLAVLTLVLIVTILFSRTCSTLNAMLAFLGIAVGCLAFGGSIGFLFGIPKVQKAKTTTITNDSGETPVQTIHGSYADNTNLEEISDWLTKIILGLALVELKSILTHLDVAARNVSVAISGKCCSDCAEDFYVFAYATLVFYFLIGAGLCYLWTRSNLLTILEERRLTRLRKQNEVLDFEKKIYYDKLKAANEILNKPIEEDESATESTPADGDENAAGQTEANAANGGEVIVAQGELKRSSSFRNETMRIYNNRPVQDPDDLQKNRWGSESQVQNFLLTASYNAQRGNAGFFGVDLTVESLNPQVTLGSEVAFFLHDTFRKKVRFVDVVNNKATLQLLSFEAFTVGARTESGVVLELDLNTVKGFPEEFYY